MEYDLEINKAVQFIKDNKAKSVCLQLPDGLKPFALKIVDELEKKTESDIFIWASTCFGACDIPNVNTDLLIQWGHSEWGDLS